MTAVDNSQNRCAWTKQSQGHAKAKHVGTTIVSALAAIALASGVFLILAQQGCNLGGINSIAQVVDATWIYFGMGIAGTALLINATVIAITKNNHPREASLEGEEPQGTATAPDSRACFVWTKQSEMCTKAKLSSALIVAAIAAIALAAGVLILVQKGFNLGGINSIAQTVEVKWVCLGMGVAGAVLLIDIPPIIALTKSYRNSLPPASH